MRLQLGAMMMSDIQYHRQRASHELNLGLASSHLSAARAHLGLSTLHHQRARELEDSEPQSESSAARPPFVL